MNTYLVGGAVRDELLGLPVKDRDWVVTGASPEQMRQRGFRPVGKDFPVFLHPETHEEYALARTERKTAPGYHGFIFHADTSVTLEQDLLRRDLTINAMARDAEGRLIDPYGGADDLRKRVLRHVSPAFVEDPLRLLRVARLAARFYGLGFSVADETMVLLRALVDRGEVDTLVAERVWQELDRALGEKTPRQFLEVLRSCRALKRLLPEVDALFGVPQPVRYHPEIDTGVHTLMALDRAAELSDVSAVRFAAMCHDLGKAVTPRAHWPSHRGHETLGLPLLHDLASRMKIPRRHHELAEVVMRFHGKVHRTATSKPATIVKLFDETDAWRRPQRFEHFLLCCQADYQGRGGSFPMRSYHQAGLLLDGLRAAGSVDVAALRKAGVSGRNLGERIRQERIHQVRLRLEQFTG